jgi:serine/threonine protein kinase
MSADANDKSIPAPLDDAERALREAEARALAESGLGSGLLARQSAPSGEAAIAVVKICPQCGREYETTSRFCPEDGTALRPKGSDSLIGRTLAERYHVLKRIGEGGMGRVYLGEHVKMNRQCAIKVMSPSLVNDAESAARFAREASNAARIIHPNVAAVFDFGESEGVVYLVMEYVEGEPLSRILAREAPLSVVRAVDLTKQIADGLNAAHELGIVHRDLKPDNILVMRTRGGKEVAKVVDFGIAKAVQEQAGEGLTRTGQVIGTPEFMSPEQLYGDNVDARSDLYALGCILHLMLTAQPPFEAQTREQMIKRRLSEDPASVHILDPGIPDVVANVVAKLLARSPGDRYGSAAEVHDALDGNLARKSGHENRPSLSLRYTPRSAPTVAFLHATQATTEITEIPRAKPVRRLPYVIGGVAIAGIAAAVVFMNPGTSAAPPVTNPVVVPDTTKIAPPADTTPSIPAAGVPVQMVDTAKLNARLAQQRREDSLAKVAQAASSGARAAVTRYGKAFESMSVSALKLVYPALPQQQQDLYQKNFFDRMDRIDTQVSFSQTKVVGDSADSDFALKLTYVDKSTKQPSDITLRQRAKLVRTGGGWQIVSVTTR